MKQRPRALICCLLSRGFKAPQCARSGSSQSVVGDDEEEQGDEEEEEWSKHRQPGSRYDFLVTSSDVTELLMVFSGLEPLHGQQRA